MRCAWPGIVAVVRGDAREQVLELLARHQVAVGQGGPAEIGQQHVARAVDMDLVATWHLHCVEHVGFPLADSDPSFRRRRSVSSINMWDDRS